MFSFFKRLKKKAKVLGPGFITGAADDDPSGIATYSIAGAQFGFKLLFLSWLLVPMMIAVQEACARIGLLTGKGLAGVLKKYYSQKILLVSVLLLLIANVINIGADLGIMAQSAKMLFGLPFVFWLIIMTVVTIAFEIAIPYRIYSKFLLVSSMFLLVYVLTSFLAIADWRNVLWQAIIPHFSLQKDFLMTIVGFLGTTISPYLFFWQTSEEVEEKIKRGLVSDFGQVQPALSGREVRLLRQDTNTGMIFSNLITFFIIATTAATLNKNGIFIIETPQQAALALKPLAGQLAYLLFTIGIIGIGLQSIPVLAGSAAYAVAETFGFSEGLFKNFNRAKLFYFTIAISIIVGVLINIFNINTIQALYYSAIINGIISVPLIFVIMKVANDVKVVGKNTSPSGHKFFGWMAFCFMLIAVILMMAAILKVI